MIRNNELKFPLRDVAYYHLRKEYPLKWSKALISFIQLVQEEQQSPHDFITLTSTQVNQRCGNLGTRVLVKFAAYFDFNDAVSKNSFKNAFKINTNLY